MRLSYPVDLWDQGVPRDPAFRELPLYQLVLVVLLVHVYREVLVVRLFLGDLVYLGVLVFSVFLCYLLVLVDKAFHLWHRIDFAANEVHL